MTSTFNKILTALFLMSYVLVLISFQSDAYERTKVKNQELSQELQEVKGEAKELQQKINDEIAKNVKMEFKWVQKRSKFKNKLEKRHPKIDAEI